MVVWGWPREIRNKLLSLGAVALVAGGSWGVSHLPDPNESALLSEGTPAPAFELKDTNGKLIDIGTFRGRPLLLNFMASWCNPCREELPLLNRTAAQYAAAKLAIVAIDVGEQPGRVAAFAKEQGVSFPILVDSDETVAGRYEISAFPTSYLIAPDGRVAGVHIGAFPENLQGRSQMEFFLRGSLGLLLVAAQQEASHCHPSDEVDPLVQLQEASFLLGRSACGCGCDQALKDCRCDAARGGQAMRVYLEDVLQDPDFSVSQAVEITQMKFRARHAD